MTIQTKNKLNNAVIKTKWKNLNRDLLKNGKAKMVETFFFFRLTDNSLVMIDCCTFFNACMIYMCERERCVELWQEWISISLETWWRKKNTITIIQRFILPISKMEFESRRQSFSHSYEMYVQNVPTKYQSVISKTYIGRWIKPLSIHKTLKSRVS